MPPKAGPLAELFAEAQQHHQGGRFVEAEKLYRQVVDGEQGHIGGWHHLGLVRLAQNKLKAAEEAFQGRNSKEILRCQDPILRRITGPDTLEFLQYRGRGRPLLPRRAAGRAGA
jgi:hypothetical protein